MDDYQKATLTDVHNTLDRMSSHIAWIHRAVIDDDQGDGVTMDHRLMLIQGRLDETVRQGHNIQTATWITMFAVIAFVVRHW